MTDKTADTDIKTPDADEAAECAAEPTIWDDPSVPVGDAPLLSKAPLVALSIAWLGWTVFLLVMMITRTHATIQ